MPRVAGQGQPHLFQPPQLAAPLALQLPVGPVELGHEVAVRQHQLLPLQRSLHRLAQEAYILQRLAQIVAGAHAKRLDGRGEISVGTQDHRLRIRRALLDLAQQRQPIHIRQAQIDDDDVVEIPFQEGHRLPAVVCQ
jgi:hypothetical protein